MQDDNGEDVAARELSPSAASEETRDTSNAAQGAIPEATPVMFVSWSEYLLPTLYATMEACSATAILITLASVHFFGMQQPMMPLWAPFLLLLGTTLLGQILKMQPFPGDAYAPHHQFRFTSGSMIAVQVVMIIVVIWGSLYGSYPFWDGSWIVACVSDLLAFQLTTFTMLCIGVIAYLLCYYGLRITRMTIDKGRTRQTLLSRGGVLFLTILLQAVGDRSYALPLLLSIAFFLICGLCTHALAHAIFLRYHHLTGLQSSRQVQDGMYLMTLVPFGLLFLMLALVIGLLSSPALLDALLNGLSPLGILFNGLLYLIAVITSIILYPVFWLLSVTGFKATLHPLHLATNPATQKAATAAHHPVSTMPAATATIGGVVLLILILAVLVALTLLFLKRYRGHQLHIELEHHETLWSWNLFWSQCKGIFLSLWRWLFARRGQEQGGRVVATGWNSRKNEALDSVRAIYRAFLAWAERRGIQRRRSETPGEYKQRVDRQLALAIVAPETKVLTDTYNAERYGQRSAPPEQLQRMHSNWQQLQQKVSAYDEKNEQEKHKRR